MQKRQPFQLEQFPWRDGFRLAILNTLIGVFCALSFVGTLLLMTTLQLPFPYPFLFLLYIVLCLGAWAWFGRQLVGPRLTRLYAALIGAVPFWGLSLLGYLATISVALMHDVMSFFVGGLLATLVLCAGVTSIAVVVLVGTESQDMVSAR